MNLLIFIRVITFTADVVFMILLPYAVHIRVDFLGRTWLLVCAIEIAWLSDCIQIVLRIVHDSPWNWIISPFYLVASLLALAYILRAGHQ